MIVPRIGWSYDAMLLLLYDATFDLLLHLYGLNGTQNGNWMNIRSFKGVFQFQMKSCTYHPMSVDCLDVVAVKHLVGIPYRQVYLSSLDGG